VTSFSIANMFYVFINVHCVFCSSLLVFSHLTDVYTVCLSVDDFQLQEEKDVIAAEVDELKQR